MPNFDELTPDQQYDIAKRSHPASYAEYVTYDARTRTSEWRAARHLDFISKKIVRGMAKGGLRLIVNVPARHGKLLAHSTPMLTTDGWKTHGDLRPGDCVYGLDGKPTKIVAVGQEDWASMEVELAIGGGSQTTTKIKTHPDHEWAITARSGNATAPKNANGTWTYIRDTLWLAGMTPYGTPRGKKRVLRSGKTPRCTYQVPQRSCLQFPYQEQPLHPYFLGVWLGDGRSSGADFCYADKDEVVLRAVEELGYSHSWYSKHKTTGVNYVGFKDVRKHLIDLRVLNNKHIPAAYKYASRDQRLELLAGLVDTDGYVDKTGRVVFVTVSDLLRDDLMELVRGLGWNVFSHTTAPALSTSGIQGKLPVHSVTFIPGGKVPTRIPRKVIEEDPEYVFKRSGFVSAVPCTPEMGRCIQVEAEDGIYLAGKELIPTHNSMLISKWTPIWFLETFPTKRVVVCSYGSNLAEYWGAEARNEIQKNKRIHVSLREDSQAVGQWRTPQGGGMKAEGVGGSLLGFGFDLGLIDDPIKNYDDAVSEAIQDTLWNWFQYTFLTRKEPGANIVILMHRWATNDFCGRLMMEDKDTWECIKLPCLADVGDPLGRSPGEALWPERWPADCKEIKEAQKSVAWWPMFQQNPKLENESRVYDHFTQDGNLDKNTVLKKGPDEVLAFTIDFNTNPGSHAEICQYDARADMFIFHDEIHGPGYRTEHVMKDFIKWLANEGHRPGACPWKHVAIYGDRSGNSPTTVTTQTDYGLIQKMLKEAGVPFRMYIPMKNPSVNDRVLTVNMALRDLEGRVHLKVNPRCKRLVVDFATQPRDDVGQPEKEKDRKLGHASDATGYICFWLRPVNRMEFKPQRVLGG